MPIQYQQMIFFKFHISLFYLYRGLQFGLILRHNLNNAMCYMYLGMKFARLHQRDLSSIEGDTIFPEGGGKCQDLNSKGVPPQRNEEVQVPGKDRVYL